MLDSVMAATQDIISLMENIVLTSRKIGIFVTGALQTVFWRGNKYVLQMYLVMDSELILGKYL